MMMNPNDHHYGMDDGESSPESSNGGGGGGGHGYGNGEGSARKKVKISRAKIACLPHCLEAHLQCNWPPAETRPKRGRPPKRPSLVDTTSTGSIPSFVAEVNGQQQQTQVGVGAAARNRTDSMVSSIVDFDGRQLAGISGGTASTNHSNHHQQQQQQQQQTQHLPQTHTQNHHHHQQPPPQQQHTPYPNLEQLFGNYTTTEPGSSHIPHQPLPSTQDNGNIPNRMSSINSGATNSSRHQQKSPARPSAWELGTLAQPDRGGTNPPEDFIIPDHRPVDTGSSQIVRRRRKGGFTAFDDGLNAELLDNGDLSEDIGSTFINHPVDTRGLPPATIIQDILETFFLHFACHFPYLHRAALQSMIDQGHEQSVFLFNSIAALAARFSSHPEIGPLHLAPHLYGQVFYDRAMMSIGSQSGTPSRETVTALLLLSFAAFGLGRDVDSKMWRKMSIELALEMGLHLAPTEEIEATASSEDLRFDRLVFWSVLIFDTAISFQEGRPTTIDPSEVTVSLPTEDDVHPAHDDQEQDPGESQHLRSPFPYVAETMFGLGSLSNLLNSVPIDDKFGEPEFMDQMKLIQHKIALFYDELPLDMIWSGQNLQWHYRAGSGPTYLFLHLYNFTINAVRFLVDRFRATNEEFKASGRPHDPSPQKYVVPENWLHGARFISEMLVLADIVDPVIYLANPMITHCFYIAENCFLKDMESYRHVQFTPDSSAMDRPSATPESDTVDKPPSLNQAQKLFAAISMQNIMSLKQGVSRQVLYWRGLATVQNRFDDRFGKASVSNETFAKLAKVISNPRNAPSRLGEGVMGSRKREKRHKGLAPLGGPSISQMVSTLPVMDSPMRGFGQSFLSGLSTDLPFGLSGGSTDLTSASSSSPTNFSGYPYLSNIMDSPNYGAIGMPDVQQFLQQLGVTST
ncbi:fungal-specific transcription factor domain-domain-containing protein [Kockovaella imperatae]|uniref:Fungal-specific transcription factor domain-domain-containing protein n=1 Tax=Kockovaella imperatae TaxID=4999 RepID=A0A1Y1UCE8_9TREE|nr:fungal-specific transcription factor domain-domain-containing protein [Kockovaella imperatae]ORX35689.1 fungal-specific transcription factor domain-domain-containing protein [Kockovaella imperatae]